MTSQNGGFALNDKTSVVSDSDEDLTWFTSKEAKSSLRITDCELMHLRLAGKLQFRKEGNRFFYLLPSSKTQEGS